MKIKIEDVLKEYMQKQGIKEIILYVHNGSGYGTTSFLSVKARFPKKKDVGLEAQGYEFIECEAGRIYYQPDELIFEDNAQLLCNRFLGKVIIQTMGISVNRAAFAV